MKPHRIGFSSFVQGMKLKRLLDRCCTFLWMIMFSTGSNVSMLHQRLAIRYGFPAAWDREEAAAIGRDLTASPLWLAHVWVLSRLGWFRQFDWEGKNAHSLISDLNTRLYLGGTRNFLLPYVVIDWFIKLNLKLSKSTDTGWWEAARLSNLRVNYS